RPVARNRLGLGRLAGVRAGKEIERVAVLAEREKHAAVLRILLEQFESEDLRVERLGFLDVANVEQDVADALELDHGASSLGPGAVWRCQAKFIRLPAARCKL